LFGEHGTIREGESPNACDGYCLRSGFGREFRLDVSGSLRFLAEEGSRTQNIVTVLGLLICLRLRRELLPAVREQDNSDSKYLLDSLSASVPDLELHNEDPRLVLFSAFQAAQVGVRIPQLHAYAATLADIFTRASRIPIALATEIILLIELGTLPRTFCSELVHQWLDHRNQQLELDALLAMDRRQKVELLNDLAILDSLANPIELSSVRFISLIPLLDTACQEHDVVLSSCLVRVLSTRSRRQSQAARVLSEALAFLCDQQRIARISGKQPIDVEDMYDSVVPTVQVLWAVLTYATEMGVQ
jgi:hypothetical protein